MTILGASWVDAAACSERDAERLFGRAGAAIAARTVCGRCPVRAECLSHALQAPEEFGVWGGLTAFERHVLRRAFPEVDDWGTAVREDLEWLIAALDETRSITDMQVARKLRAILPTRAEKGDQPQ